MYLQSQVLIQTVENSEKLLIRIAKQTRFGFCQLRTLLNSAKLIQNEVIVARF